MSAFPKRSSREERHRFRDIGFFSYLGKRTCSCRSCHHIYRSLPDFIPFFCLLLALYNNFASQNIVIAETVGIEKMPDTLNYHLTAGSYWLNSISLKVNQHLIFV